MQDIIPTLATTAFLVFCYDQKVIASLQRQGKYDPDTLVRPEKSRHFLW